VEESGQFDVEDELFWIERSRADRDPSHSGVFDGKFW
jgi:hypothetical protein